MATNILEISALEINSADNPIMADLFGFLKSQFHDFAYIQIKENGKKYTLAEIDKLAEDIVSIKEQQ